MKGGLRFSAALISFTIRKQRPNKQNNKANPPTRSADGDQGSERQENEIRGCALLLLLRIAFVEVNVKKPEESGQSARQRVEMEMSDECSDSEKLNHRKDGFGESDRLCLYFLHI